MDESIEAIDGRFNALFFVGFTLALGAVSSIWNWTPALLVRVFGMSIDQVDWVYGLIFSSLALPAQHILAGYP